MPDFSTFAGIQKAREALYDKYDAANQPFDATKLLKDAEESLLSQEQLKLYLKGGG